jgi:divalent metal cation (Fe/Co/Zn/Cd) transporter
LAAATRAAGSAPGVRAVTVQGRWTGRTPILDVHGQVDSDLPVAEADRLGDAVASAVHEAVEEARVVRWSASAARQASHVRSR